MTIAMLKRELKLLNIDAATIAFYKDLDGSVCFHVVDSIHDYCDLTGDYTMVVPCVAHTLDGEHLKRFNASEELVGGLLGKLARAF